MRKRQITSTLQSTRASEEAWLDLDHAALVEVTSEEEGYPIESALVGEDKRGWQAGSQGSQTIRLIFDQPQRFKRIWLVFEDGETSARKNSFCDPLRIRESLSGKSYASSGISVRLIPYARSKIMLLICTKLRNLS